MQESRIYFDFGTESEVKPEVVAKFKETTVKEASSNSHCLSSQEHVQVVEKLLMRN